MSKKSCVISFKLDKQSFEKLENITAPDSSVHLTAREIAMKALQSGKHPIEEPDAPSLARAAWLIISKLNTELTTDEAADLVRHHFLDPRNSPPLKSDLSRFIWVLIATLDEKSSPSDVADLVCQCFEEGNHAPEFKA
jgi:hypothetical protein